MSDNRDKSLVKRNMDKGFLREENLTLKFFAYTVKKHMSCPGVRNESDILLWDIPVVQIKDGIPGNNEKIIGVISVKDVVSYMAENSFNKNDSLVGIMRTENLEDAFHVISEDSLVSNVPAGKFCIVKDSEGNITGWI